MLFFFFPQALEDEILRATLIEIADAQRQYVRNEPAAGSVPQPAGIASTREQLEVLTLLALQLQKYIYGHPRRCVLGREHPPKKIKKMCPSV